MFRHHRCFGVLLLLCPFLFAWQPPAADLSQVLSDLENRHAAAKFGNNRQVLILGLGDSLTHGTMDGTNNNINSQNAYLQLVADAISQVEPVLFHQPFFDTNQKRIDPWRIPTNLAVDGATVFTIDGLAYAKAPDSPKKSNKLMCNQWFPAFLNDKYDKVLFPINWQTNSTVSTVDAAAWWLAEPEVGTSALPGLVFLWAGNNDSSKAALGSAGADGGLAFPLPYDLVRPELTWTLRLTLDVGLGLKLVNFSPYTAAAINAGLTEIDDFAAQYHQVVDRLASAAGDDDVTFFLMTLPYYGSVGYLFDSEDLEFYLGQVNPDYRVPQSFARVAPRGEDINDFTKGDRVSIFTFGFMYLLLESGYSVDEVNRALETNGVQRDGLVLSEQEQAAIRERIDHFNAVIDAEAATRGDRFVRVDIGGFLNRALTGDTVIYAGDQRLTRKWTRGAGFSLDGVHPGYTGQALVANYVLDQVDEARNLSTPRYDLAQMLGRDPYHDQDGDGWARGPNYNPVGLTQLLFLFLDPDDQNPQTRLQLPDDVWQRVSNVILGEVTGIPGLKQAVAQEKTRREAAAAQNNNPNH